MSKRSLVFAIIIIILLTMVYGLYKHILMAKKQAYAMIPTVEVAKAQSTKWQDQINATGNISAINGAMIRPEVAGTVTKIYFESGDYVQKGQPLFQIYPDILEAQLQSNESALALAQVDYQRAVALYDKRVISQQQLDTQTNNLRNAQAMLDQTKAQLVQHNIVAPVSGRLGLKYVDVGDYVNAGADLVNLQQIDPLRIEFSVPDRFINQVKIGDKVEIMPSSTPDEIYVGDVYALDSAVNTQSQSFSMWAQIPNPYHQLLPGAYVYVTLYAGKPKSVITVPQTAVSYSPEGSYVFTIDNDTAKKVQVVAGERVGDDIEIISGLKAGDTVVTAGQVKIFDGSKVHVAPTQTYEASTATQPVMVTFATKPRNSEETADAKINNPENSSVSPLPFSADQNNANGSVDATAASDANAAPSNASTTPSNPTPSETTTNANSGS